MSLLLALLSWLIVKQITNNDITVSNVPVNIIMPEGWAIRDKDINEVKIRFLGTSKDLARLDRQMVEVNIDLRNEDFENTKTVTILPRHVTTTSRNTRISSIQPEVVVLTLGKEGQKNLPVVVNQTGQPPEGYKVEAVELTPSLATLVGAENLLEGISALQTAPLNLSEKIQSFEQRLDILPPNSEWVGRVEPSRVLVRVTLTGLTVERKFEGIPLMLTHPVGQEIPLRQVVEPAKVDVFLKGSPQLLEELDVRRIQAFVSADNLELRERNSRKINVLVPVGIEVLATQPEMVSVRTLPAPTPTPVPTPVPVAPPPETPASLPPTEPVPAL